MNEIYKDIPWYEWLYAVTKDWKVFSHPKYRNKNSLYLKTTTNHGYYSVWLYKSWKHKIIRVHRLVAMTYIPNPNNKTQINHINGIKTDNRVENLEWCTASENTIHSYSKWLRIIWKKHRESARKFCIETKSKPIMQLTKDGILCKIYKSRSDAERETWIIWTNISKCIYWKYKSAGWYLWQYVIN